MDDDLPTRAAEESSSILVVRDARKFSREANQRFKDA